MTLPQDPDPWFLIYLDPANSYGSYWIWICHQCLTFNINLKTKWLDWIAQVEDLLRWKFNLNKCSVWKNLENLHYNRILSFQKDQSCDCHFRWRKHTRAGLGANDPKKIIHCPKNSLNLLNKAEPVTMGADATVYVWFLCQMPRYMSGFCARYACLEAEHIPFHMLHGHDTLSFLRRDLNYLGTVSSHI